MSNAFQVTEHRVKILRDIQNGAKHNGDLIKLGHSGAHINARLTGLEKSGFILMEHRDYYRWVSLTDKAVEWLKQFKGEKVTEQEIWKTVNGEHRSKTGPKQYPNTPVPKHLQEVDEGLEDDECFRPDFES